MSRQPQKPNLVTELTLKTLNNVKATAPPLFTDFHKAVQKYQQALQVAAQAGIVLADTIYKIGASHSGDLGEGVRKLAEYVKDSETRREEISRMLLTDLIVPLKQNGENEQRDTMQFEKNYKKDRDSTRQEIMKLEAKTKKAGKKTSPELLKQQITELNDKIKEAETMRANKFRDVVVLERRKYASFLTIWNTILAKETEVHTEMLNKLKGNEANWIALANSSTQLPKEFEEMLQKQERTFVQIQQMPDQENYRISYAPSAYNNSMTNLHQYAAGYDSYDSYAYDSSAYDQSSYSYDYGAGGYDQGTGGGGGSRQARALYDYVGDESTDLRLTAGDTITIVQDDDGSGWTKGQDSQGNFGIFPTSYIEYI